MIWLKYFIKHFLTLSFITATVLLPIHASGIKIYVSPSGNDANPGIRKQPMASLNRALEKVRMLKKIRGNNVPVEVIIGSGEYLIREPVIISQQHSGAEGAKFLIRAAFGKNPVFTGSLPLRNWKLLADRSKLSLLDPDVAGKIYFSNLKEEGISDFGDPAELGKRPDLICNGKLQKLARWPNEGFTSAGLVKGKTELPPTYIKKRGTKEGEFEYIGERQKRWVNEPDIRLGGYWYWDWSEEFQKVERIDTVSGTIFISEPFHRYGYRDSLRYFGLNLFCEIDRPGEWYLDRESGLIYWYPPEDVNPNEGRVTFTFFDAPFMVEIQNCSNLTLKGLTFSESRGSAILISDGKKCLVKDCLIERFGSDGIHVEGGNDHGISGCVLTTLGCGGIRMRGGDRKTLEPADHFVEKTIIEHFSLFKRTYEPAIHLDGCGIRVSNNRFSDSSSSAMRLEGNDFLIEYNQVDHVVNESDDQGGIDIFYNPSYQGIVIRYNHWSDITGGTRHGAAGVRLDDMISGVQIYGNIFERCGARDFGGVQIHGGKDNVVNNNLFYKCNAAVSFTGWSEDRWLKSLDSPVIKKKIYEDVDISSPIYLQKYPNLKDIRLNPNLNAITNNLIVDCKNQFLRKNYRQVEINNTALKAEFKGIESFYSGKLLKKYGLNPIPYKKIGLTEK